MRIPVLLAALLLTACSSQPQQSSSYLLRSGAGLSSGELQSDSGIALGSIRVATYIEQPGLVLATGDGKVHAARNHRWAEPLTVSLRRFLAQEVAASLGTGVATDADPGVATRVDVAIDQLHGDGEGTALLVAYWTVESAGASTDFQFAEHQALAVDGYDALAQAEATLLKKLAAAIADSLR